MICAPTTCDLYTFPIETDQDLCGVLKIMLRVCRPVGWDIRIDCSMIYKYA